MHKNACEEGKRTRKNGTSDDADMEGSKEAAQAWKTKTGFKRRRERKEKRRKNGRKEGDWRENATLYNNINKNRNGEAKKSSVAKSEIRARAV